MGRNNQHDTWRNECRVSNAGATGAARAGVLVRLMRSGRPSEQWMGGCRLWGREIQVRAEPAQRPSARTTGCARGTRWPAWLKTPQGHKREDDRPRHGNTEP